MDRRTLLKATLGIAVAPKALTAKPNKSHHILDENSLTYGGTDNWKGDKIIFGPIPDSPLTTEQIIALIKQRNQETWQQTAELIERDLWGTP